MPKVISPDPNRRQTRPGNANAHPGKIVMEALAVRRKREEIDEEKKEQSKRRETREKKKANKKTAVVEIADFEHAMAIGDTEIEAQFPRYKTKGMQLSRRLENI
jgi:hypothetical protein